MSWENGDKRIEVCEIRIKDIVDGIGNPRKIEKKKRDELKESLERDGDYGIIVVDEHNNLISGHQRISILRAEDDSQTVVCKKLYGYTEAELRRINIKSNTHAGDWDLDMLADWTSDLEVDLDIGKKKTDIEGRKIPDMELIHYEKYDYVMIVCRNEIDYLDLIRKLGIEGRKIKIAKKRKINARAIWYEDMKAQIVEKEQGDEDSSDPSA